MEIKTTQDAEEVFGQLVSRVLPDLIRNISANIRLGKIIAVNEDSQTADITLLGTNLTLQGVKYSKGESVPVVNNSALVISPDPKNTGQNFIVGVY